ncbi:hypothetical protein ACFYO0_05205 [Streptomyces sp. NPDC006365]|uniref:hypothetical protein n=1 Tax=Streptomyces sp. NPDC006365 TaxID=3364744 RepID=UPI0036B7A944
MASSEATYAALHPIVRWTSEDGVEHERALPDMISAHRVPKGIRVRLLVMAGAPETAVLDAPDRYRTALVGVCLGVVLWVGTLTAVLVRIATLVPDSCRYSC